MESNYTYFSDFLFSESYKPEELPLNSELSRIESQSIVLSLHTNFGGFDAEISGTELAIIGREFKLGSACEISNFHIAYFLCEGGMTRVMHALYNILQVLQKMPSCVFNPLYSQRHRLVWCPGQPKNHKMCSRCYLSGVMTNVQFETQALDPALWKHHPSSIPLEDGASPLLTHYAHLDSLLWTYLPYQLGILMCTCRTLLLFLSKDEFWKALFIMEYPFLSSCYNEVMAAHPGCQYPALWLHLTYTGKTHFTRASLVSLLNQ
jgi:hypothetical protein